jgi:RNA polymerase sigma-70 factor (ECF subfamily)
MVAVDVDAEPLVREARAGEARAWDTIFQRYQLPLYAYARELVHDEQASLDIVQETFISAVRHLDSLRDDGKLGSWLFGIAHQKVLQHWRRTRRHPEEPVDEIGEDAPTGEPDPSEWLIEQERQQAFMDGLQQLTPDHRAVLVLHFLEDFALEEIADITGVPLGTVKSRLYHAKRQLRRIVEELT